MNNSGKEKEQAETKAIFTAGQIMGLALRLNVPLLKEAKSKSKGTDEFTELLDQLDVDALERFLKSNRSRNPDDPFRYRSQCEELIRYKRSIGKKR